MTKGINIIHFSETFHPEFRGWIGEDGGGVWVSFIVSKDMGRGNFSRFLGELRKKYAWIKVPTPSERMRRICLKKGFRAVMEYFPAPFDEMGEVLVWER